MALARETGQTAAAGGSGRGAAADSGEASRLELDLTGLCLQMDDFGPDGQHSRRVALSVHHIEVTTLNIGSVGRVAPSLAITLCGLGTVYSVG